MDCCDYFLFREFGLDLLLLLLLLFFASGTASKIWLPLSMYFSNAVLFALGMTLLFSLCFALLVYWKLLSWPCINLTLCNFLFGSVPLYWGSRTVSQGFLSFGSSFSGADLCYLGLDALIFFKDGSSFAPLINFWVRRESILWETKLWFSWFSILKNFECSTFDYFWGLVEESSCLWLLALFMESNLQPDFNRGVSFLLLCLLSFSELTFAFPSMELSVIFRILLFLVFTLEVRPLIRLTLEIFIWFRASLEMPILFWLYSRLTIGLFFFNFWFIFRSSF